MIEINYVRMYHRNRLKDKYLMSALSLTLCNMVSHQLTKNHPTQCIIHNVELDCHAKVLEKSMCIYHRNRLKQKFDMGHNLT